MTNSSIIVDVPQPQLNLRTAADVQLAFPPLYSKRMKTLTPIWVVATMIPTGPTGTIGVINHVTNVHTGWTSMVLERQSAAPMAGATYFFLGGRKKPGSSGLLKDNGVIAKVNNVEVARIYVDPDTQTVGWTGFALFGDMADFRFALTGTVTTGDLRFTISQPDPLLQLQLILGGRD